ncbi:hypothetical protein HOO65_020206 [Ceratocystis lukuohia]|uniref:DNA endonuclease activator Ctp1 C-terminal domain-containing protein n=1 Tax=Ceratocystis lukuohia TaxID=2019550 RepID=A0ABR4MN06_9PEZI
MSLSSWHEKGRPALFEALATVCDRIDEEIEAEVRNKVSTCKHNLKPGELEALQVRATEADRLEKDNHRLREALSRLQKEKAAQELSKPPLGAAVTPQALAVQDTNTTANIIKLESSLRTLKKNFLTAKDSLIKRKNERDQWIEYSKNLEKKIASLKSKLKSAQATVTSGLGVVSGDQAGEKTNDTIAIPNTSFSSDAGNGGHRGGAGITTTAPTGALETGEFELPPISSMAPPPSTINEERICDSQPPDENETLTSDGATDSATQNLPVLSTVASVSANVQIKEEPSSDDRIVVVEERAVKKRKYNSEHTGRSPAISRIKEEHFSSDSLSSADMHGFSPQESVDLDNVGGNVETPRKGRTQEDLACSLNVEVYSSQPSVIPDSPYQPASDERTPTAARSHLGATHTHTTHINLLAQSAGTPLQGRAGRASLETSSDKTTPVTAIKSTRTMPRSFAAAPTSPLNDVRGASDLRREGRRTSLGSTKIGRTPSTNITSGAPTQRSSRVPPNSGSNTLAGLDVPEPRRLPFDNVAISRSSLNRSFHEEPESISRRNDASTSRGPNMSFSGALETTPTHVRTGAIRTKRPHELQPEDFKINPKFNDGRSYAYTEVVRGRAERAALPGCTDPTCCGQDFRMLARSERGTAPRTAEQLVEDKLYLERYLGDECFRLFAMTREELDELWIEAKAKELADRWGKHRHRFSRMKSPPGFWNPDFPTTQEARNDRDEADKRKKQEVEGRYREAMRPGGRWMFRDE